MGFLGFAVLVVLGWLCCGLRSGEASVMERQRWEMRDEDKIYIYIYIFFFTILLQCNSTFRIPLELHYSSIAKKICNT